MVGVNVQPLLAAGGVSGIAIGFGAQKLTQNVLSGAKLFLTQPFVVGERVRLEQVLVNLLQNALDAMEGQEDGRIAIEVRASDGTVDLTVRDNGPGIPA